MSGISKRVSGSWVSGDYGIMKTSTDTITTLPADVYADGNNATVGLKGNMSQTSGVSPTTPIQPQECGDLETSGEHSGQYKIPISSGGTTTPVYLGEVETTRRIKKLVLTGKETIGYSSSNNTFIFTLNNGYYTGLVRTTPLFCSHYIHIDDGRPFSNMPNNSIYIASYGSATGAYIYTTNYADLSGFKSYLAQQYATGTPVTVWYVLATEETGIVNEPLMKIGEYADTVSGITIPTIAGANSFDVLTTLKPSEVTVNYHGWYTGTVHERESGQWT